MEHPENSAEYAGLQVNSGIEQPSIINPYLKRNRFRRRDVIMHQPLLGHANGAVAVQPDADSESYF